MRKVRLLPTTPYFWMALIAGVFVVWCGRFIFESSFVAINGRRYYTLVDDAMISMRYAWNLSHGHGLVWNPGEYVEGITNFLMTLYMAAGIALFDKIGATLFVRISGVGFMLAVAYLNMKIADVIFRDAGRRSFYRVLGFAAGLCYYPLAWFTLEGMETGMLTVWLLLAMWLAIRADDRPEVTPLLPAAMGLAFLTRPDALVPCYFIFMYRAFNVRRAPNEKRILLVELAILGAFVGGMTAFRLLYYGEPVPNTFVLRVQGHPLLLRLYNGWRFTTPYLKMVAPLLVVAVVGVVRRFRKEKLLLLLLFLSLVGYQIWAGGDIFAVFGNYYRMPAPMLPALFLLCAEGLRHIAGAGGRAWARRASPALVAAGMAVLVVVANWDSRDEILLRAELPIGGAVELTGYAIVLDHVLRPDATIAVAHAGTKPYYTERRAIDILGRADPHVARLPPIVLPDLSYYPAHDKYDLAYSVLELQPDFTEWIQRPDQNLLDVEHYGAHKYKLFAYGGFPLWLRTDSSSVNWDRVHAAGR